MSTQTRARHRMARHPKTPLTDLGEVVTTVGNRRNLTAIASTGIALTVAGAYVADAAPESVQPAEGVNVSALTVKAQAQIASNPTQATSADAAWAAADEEQVVTVEKVVPPPPPVPARRAAARQSAPADGRQGAPAAAVNIPPAPSGSIVAIALQYQGVPYVYGGTSPSGFDCSGFVQYVHAQAGISLPRTGGAQAASGTRISAADAQPGDVLVFRGGGHVGIYLGGGQMIHAPSRGKVVSVVPIYATPTSYVRF